MRRSLKPAFAVTALLALTSSWVLGCSVALHLAHDDDHHDGSSPDQDNALGLEMALHGHAHTQGTTAHEHPFMGSVAAPLPAKFLLLTYAKVGLPPGFALAQNSSRRLRAQAGPTHDPPPRLETVSVLRI